MGNVLLLEPFEYGEIGWVCAVHGNSVGKSIKSLVSKSSWVEFAWRTPIAVLWGMGFDFSKQCIIFISILFYVINGLLWTGCESKILTWTPYAKNVGDTPSIVWRLDYK